jgi:type IV pilus assembly protein PilM
LFNCEKKGDDYAVTAAGFADVCDRTGNDDAHREFNIIKAIRQCTQSAGIQSKLAVCGAGGPESTVRRFTFPLMPQDEIPGAVMLEAKQICPFNCDEGVVDYQLVPDKQNINGILAAATNRLLKEKIKLTEIAELHGVLMDIEGLALLNCFRGCQKDAAGQTIAILNVGSSYATLVIESCGNLPFIRDLTCGSKVIIENMASKSSISAEIAEKILTGKENSNKIRTKLYSNLETACHKLITDVTETLRYYTVRRKAGTVEKVFICGGFALLERFVDLLSSQLPAASVLWNPFDTISCDESLACGDILRRKGPAMAVAAGLAMRTV